MTKTATDPIDMPPPATLPKAAGKFRYFLPFLLLWLMLASGVGWWIWAQFGDINSSQAVLEGEVLTVIPPISAPVAEIYVNENQEVTEGQPLARLEGGPPVYGNTSQPQGQQARAYSPEDTTRRAADAKTREEAFVRRAAEARQEEAVAVRDLEALSVAHVRAQLEVRSLEAMGVNVPRESQDRARQAELAARVRMEAARSAREEASRVRAAVEAELLNMRSESKLARNQSVPDMPSAYAGMPNPNVVVAPGAGRVIGVGTLGAMARRGYPLMTIITPGGSGLWVMAYFREKPASSISPGQPCKIIFEGYETQPVNGIVEEVSPISGKGMERQVPVKIRLNPDSAKSRPAMNLGMKAAVIVHTRPLPTSFLPEALRNKI